jgi:serine acetyltransferase
MLNGVTIIDPDVTYIDYGVKAGKDTTIHPNVHLLGQTSVGAGCTVEEGVRIADSTIGSTTTVKSFSVIESSKVGKGVSIGPFARLRPENTIGDGARVGNFVEVKKTLLGKGSKANHLTYLGDSVIGNDYPGRGLHRQRLTAHSPGYRWEERIHRLRLHHYKGRARGVSRCFKTGAEGYKGVGQEKEVKEEAVIMCGIVGYIGPREAADVILEGLKRLEYRGYDSSGLAVVSDGRVELRRSAGKIERLCEKPHWHRPHPLGDTRKTERGERPPAP